MIIDPYAWHRLPITSITRLTPESVSVSVPRPGHYSFRAGQYAIVRVSVGSGQYIRQYSFASPPQSDQLEFLIQHEQSGVVSGWFNEEASVGAEIEVSQPFGDFTIKHPDQPHVLIAGRAGIAPFLSMLRDARTLEQETQINVIYSARGADDFCYPELLLARGAKLIDSRDAGHITQHELTSYAASSHHFYLCGSKRFVDALETLLAELNVPTTHIHRERFTLQ